MELNPTQPADSLPEGIPPMSKRWLAILRGESALAFPQRAGRRIFGLMPSASRCKFCNAPFKGRYAGAFSAVGYTPSRKNPDLCARCIESAPEGGAIVPVAVLFADVRGYTALCEQLDPDEVTKLVQRFYETSSAALLAQECLLGQIAGDEVEGLFVPGLAGPNYRRKAVEAARSLVRAVRYTESSAGTLEVGIGVASGEEFVGNVGRRGLQGFRCGRRGHEHRLEADYERPEWADRRRRGDVCGRRESVSGRDTRGAGAQGEARSGCRLLDPTVRRLSCPAAGSVSPSPKGNLWLPAPYRL